jgi:hypothetical protein
VLPAHFASIRFLRQPQKKVRGAWQPRTEPVPLQEGGDRTDHSADLADCIQQEINKAQKQQFDFWIPDYFYSSNSALRN